MASFEEDKMKERSWLIHVWAYILSAIVIIITSYLLGYLLLDMPIWYISIFTGLSLLAAATGVFGRLIAKTIKQKKK